MTSPKPILVPSAPGAVALIAAYQGISLLTNTFRDPGLLVREAARLANWIESLR